MTTDRDFRLGVIARQDLTGLGNQSRNWVRLLNPDKVIVIDSTPFNHNEQFPIYENYNNIIINGFIQDWQFDQIFEGIDLLLTFETGYNNRLFEAAQKRGIKTIMIYNWEFLDYLQNPYLPRPDILANHSLWHLEDVEMIFGDDFYLPTPIFTEDYASIFDDNLRQCATHDKPKFLHIAGRKTYEDRNGTEDLLRAVSLVPRDIEFELTIKTQTTEVESPDPRVKIDSSSPQDEKELYRGYNAMFLPRRYGGASLPMQEAFAAGLPVIMTDISPNNQILPGDWLVRATKRTSFMARTEIDVYQSDLQDLADKIARWAIKSHSEREVDCIISKGISLDAYSAEAVEKKWNLLLLKMGL